MKIAWEIVAPEHQFNVSVSKLMNLFSVHCICKSLIFVSAWNLGSHRHWNIWSASSLISSFSMLKIHIISLIVILHWNYMNKFHQFVMWLLLCFCIKILWCLWQQKYAASCGFFSWGKPWERFSLHENQWQIEVSRNWKMVVPDSVVFPEGIVPDRFRCTLKVAGFGQTCTAM